jgi:hypothetical protein
MNIKLRRNNIFILLVIHFFCLFAFVFVLILYNFLIKINNFYKLKVVVLILYLFFAVNISEHFVVFIVLVHISLKDIFHGAKKSFETLTIKGA